jgi:hypothetical protein
MIKAKAKAKVKKTVSDKNNLCILEVFGKRVLWCRSGRNRSHFYKTKTKIIGREFYIFDFKSNEFCNLRKYKDTRRSSKNYYYDWGEIDRQIYKYFEIKEMIFLETGERVTVNTMPEHMIELRNIIIELLFNLVNTIIYAHSFHQQIDDTDLFQDSIEKLIGLLDNDKYSSLRGTSFTFFTIALKNMIFTQLKKNKRFVLSIDSYPNGYDILDTRGGGDDDIVIFDPTDSRDLCDVYLGSSEERDFSE